MSAPEIRLENLSEEEKQTISSVLSKRLIAKSVLFIFIIASCVITLVYFNKYSGSYRIQDNLETLNVVFVILCMIFVRFLVYEFLEYAKEIKASQKKVVRVKIAGRNGEKILLGNRAFARDEILFDCPNFDSFQSGEDVILEISSKSDMLFSITRIH